MTTPEQRLIEAERSEPRVWSYSTHIVAESEEKINALANAYHRDGIWAEAFTLLAGERGHIALAVRMRGLTMNAADSVAKTREAHRKVILMADEALGYDYKFVPQTIRVMFTPWQDLLVERRRYRIPFAADEAPGASAEA